MLWNLSKPVGRREIERYDAVGEMKREVRVLLSEIPRVARQGAACLISKNK